MPKFRFHPGVRLVLNGREHEVVKRLPDGQWQLRNVVAEKFFAAQETELATAFFEGRLELIGEERAAKYIQRKTAKNLTADFTRLPKALSSEAKRRYKYVQEASNESLTTKDPKILLPIIARVSERLKDGKPPAPITLYRWRRDFEASGEDIRALVPSTKNKGNRNDRLHEDVSRIIEEQIRTVYLSPNRPSVMDLYASIEARIAEANEERSQNGDESLCTPSIPTVYDRVDKFTKKEPYLVDKARYGERYARYHHATVGAGPRTERPLDRVEIDVTKLDLFVVDEHTRLPIGRPWLTSAIDHRSKSAMGFDLGFNPPSYLSVMNCLKHAVLPKAYLREKYPSVKNDWEMYGVPSLLVVDNGKEFLNTHLEDACLQIGTTVQFCPVKMPWYKGAIEKHFRSVKQGLLSGKPGVTFSRILDLTDYNPQKDAVISLNALLEILHIFIVDIMLRRKHRGMRDIPAEVWAAGTADFGPTLPARLSDLNVLLGHIDKRHITKRGIEFKCLFYNNDNLAPIRRMLGEQQATVKYDPNDIGTIYVHNPQTDEFVAVPAIDQSYAGGLTLWQHDVIRSFARKRVNSTVDIAALCLAKTKIQEIIDREWIHTKGTNARQKMARWRKESSHDHIAPNPAGLQSSSSENVSSIKNITLTQAESAAWNGVSDPEDDVARLSTITGKQLSETQESAPARNQAGRILSAEEVLASRKQPRSKRAKGPPISSKSLTNPGPNATEPVSRNENSGDDSDLDVEGWSVSLS